MPVFAICGSLDELQHNRYKEDFQDKEIIKIIYL